MEPSQINKRGQCLTPFLRAAHCSRFLKSMCGQTGTISSRRSLLTARTASQNSSMRMPGRAAVSDGKSEKAAVWSDREQRPAALDRAHHDQNKAEKRE